MSQEPAAAAGTIQQRLTDEMKAAMKAGQKERLGVIRMLLSDVKNVDLNPQKPTPEQAVEAYAKKLRKSIEEFEKIGRVEEAETIRREVTIVEEFLPKKADAAETERLVDAFLAASSFTEKDVGRATGMFMKQHGGGVDASRVNPLMKSKLAGK